MLGKLLCLGALAWAAAGCGGDSDRPAAASSVGSMATMETPTGGTAPAEVRTAVAGQAISLDAGAYHVPMMTEDRRILQPVIGWGASVLASATLAPSAKQGTPTTDQQYVLLDPTTGHTTSLWTASAGRQDLVSAVDEDWVAVVEVGPSLPLADWTLVLRNLRTSEARVVATSDSSAAKVDGVEPTLPNGFAPSPGMNGGKAIWSDLVLDGPTPRHRVELYDIAHEHTTTLAMDSDARLESIWSPSIAGNMVAWAYQQSRGGPVVIETMDLAGGKQQAILDPGTVFSLRLAEGGRELVWTTSAGRGFSQDLLTGERVQYESGNVGTEVSGHYVSWWPATRSSGNVGGYYDLFSHTVRIIRETSSITMGFAGVEGKWFVWSQTPHASPADGTWSFLALPP